MYGTLCSTGRNDAIWAFAVASLLHNSFCSSTAVAAGSDTLAVHCQACGVNKPEQNKVTRLGHGDVITFDVSSADDDDDEGSSEAHSCGV